MFILSPLRFRPIALLWTGQVLSAIGDEVYKVALVWLAISLSGKDAGFLIAIESGAILISGLLAGMWAERWNHRATMAVVDIIRAVAVLSLPLFAAFFPLSLPVLIVVAVVVCALMPIFDPALQATLPELTPNLEVLHASNALMEATRRIARIAGPVLIGILGALVPAIHFFTIDAFTFLLSALSIYGVMRIAPSRKPSTTAPISHPLESLRLGFRQVMADRLLLYMVVGCLITWSLWSLCFSLGLALLVSERAPGNMSAYAWMVGSYGVGNLGCNLVLGSLRIQRPQVITFVGTSILGLGFVAIAAAPTVPLQMLAAAFCGIGGPMEDLSFLHVLQTRYRAGDIARIFRLRMVLAFGGIAVVFLLSPLLFRLFPVSGVIGGCGVLLFLFALFGLNAFRGSEHQTRRNHDGRQNGDAVAEACDRAS